MVNELRVFSSDSMSGALSDCLLSDSRAYLVAFTALSEDGRSAEFQIKASQETELDD